MRWRFLGGSEPFTFFVTFREGEVCRPSTFDVCVWFPGGRLDIAPTIAHLVVAFVVQVGILALARRHPENRTLRILVWALLPALALLKELNDGFTLQVIAGIPVGGSGFSFLDLGFSLLGQLLCVAIALAWRALPRNASPSVPG